MDAPFDITRWQPTRIPRDGDTLPTLVELRQLAQQLADRTKCLTRRPYDPEAWIERSETLRRLWYPELALSDAHKAALLFRQHLRRLEDDEARGWRLGCAMGFRMLDAQPEDHGHQQRLLTLQEKASKLEERNLCVSKSEGRGKFHPRPYPWLAPQHSRRSDSLVARINDGFAAAAAHGLHAPSLCEVRQHAFGVPTAESKDILGVFATADIPSHTTILLDTTRILGCCGPAATVTPRT